MTRKPPVLRQPWATSYRIEPPSPSHPGSWHFFCKECEASWRVPAYRIKNFNPLRLLDHTIEHLFAEDDVSSKPPALVDDGPVELRNLLKL